MSTPYLIFNNGTAKVNLDNDFMCLNLKNKPTTESETLTVIPNNTVLDILYETVKKDWAKVYYSGDTGFVPTRYLTDFRPEKQPIITDDIMEETESLRIDYNKEESTLDISTSEGKIVLSVPIPFIIKPTV